MSKKELFFNCAVTGFLGMSVYGFILYVMAGSVQGAFKDLLFVGLMYILLLSGALLVLNLDSIISFIVSLILLPFKILLYPFKLLFGF